MIEAYQSEKERGELHAEGERKKERESERGREKERERRDETANHGTENGKRENRFTVGSSAEYRHAR